MTTLTARGNIQVTPFSMLGTIYVYALVFHLAIPWLAHFLTQSSDALSLAQDLASSRWWLWPKGAASQAYNAACMVAFVALFSAVLVPKKMLTRTRQKIDTQTSGGPTPGRIAVTYIIRVGLLEIVSLAGFVAAFLAKTPGFAVPFAALGFIFTLLLPPTRYRLSLFGVGAVSLLALVAVIGACVTIPETGRSQLVAIPEGYMNQMGENAYAEMKAKEKISQDIKINSAVLDIGRRIARASEKKYEWDFTVFDSKEINAFCLPGGKVGVYTGILPVAKTNAGLAAVMGHEVAHAVARHGAERATQSLIVSGTLLSVEKVIQDPKYRQLAMAALGLGVQFGVMLPFSRSHESEADSIGLIYMARAGYDPRESVKLWERMGAAGSRPPEWLSTHPDPTRRAKDLESQMTKALSVYEKSEKIPTVGIL
jgi:Zn-dependent protease with chaperone function